jgi:Melibiase
MATPPSVGPLLGHDNDKGEPDEVATMTLENEHWKLSLHLPQKQQGGSHRPTDATGSLEMTTLSASSRSPEEQRAWLLSQSSSSSLSDSGSSGSAVPTVGWTLSSTTASFPWRLVNSPVLCQVVYYPAWQCLPEYGQDYSASIWQVWRAAYWRSLARYWWRHLLPYPARLCYYYYRRLVRYYSSNTSPLPLFPQFSTQRRQYAQHACLWDYHVRVYTTADVLHVTPVECEAPNQDGTWPAWRLQLPPLPSHGWNIPPRYQAAWQRLLQRIGGQAREADETPPLSSPVLTIMLQDKNILWKVDLPPPTQAVAIESITILQASLQDAVADGPTTPLSSTAPTHVYINGFQSWSFAGSIPRGWLQPWSALPPVFSRAFNAGASLPPPPSWIQHGQQQPSPSIPLYGAYTSDFFTCLTTHHDQQQSRWRRLFSSAPTTVRGLNPGPALVLGWLSQQEHYGLVQVDRHLRQLQMHVSAQGQVLLPGRCITTDWAYAQFVPPATEQHQEEPLSHYLHQVAAVNQAQPFGNSNLLTGWCSWYHYYENIDATTLRSNFSTLARLRHVVPTNVAVVDDGYMVAWGDWDCLRPNQFQHGLAGVAADIAQFGMRPGLWLAPYAADFAAQVTRQHPEWILRNQTGVPANSSYCGKFFYGLDATNPAVLSHAFRAVQRAVQEYRNQVLKIDFLYAACLEGPKYDPTISRAAAMRRALQTIRDAAGPSVFLIGCGCPLASGIGLVDGMRISADTGPAWYPEWPLPWWDHHSTLPCLRSMVRNSMSRAPLGHVWWHNDPDCLLLGTSTRLTPQEVASAATIVAMTCGMLLLSDDLTKLAPERLAIVSKIFPMTGVTATVLDLHCTNDGLPSLMRLWCTDQFEFLDAFRASRDDDGDDWDHHAEATYFARQASFQRSESGDGAAKQPPQRMRSCIHMTKGLGAWTMVSLSNWSDRPALMSLPPQAIHDERHLAPHGYHVFGFWSSSYQWIPQHDGTVTRQFLPHETEIFHIKPVTPCSPQYLGSDLHFSCGQEVMFFKWSSSRVHLGLRTHYDRVGFVYLYIPSVETDPGHWNVLVNGEKTSNWTVIASTPNTQLHRTGDVEDRAMPFVGQIIQVPIVLCRSDHSPCAPDAHPDQHGHIEVEYASNQGVFS